MHNQLIDNDEALRLFLTEDIYLVKEKPIADVSEPEKASTVESNLLDAAEPELLPNVQVPIMQQVLQEPLPIFKKTFDFKFKGKNQKGILILVEDEQNDLSTEAGVALLTKLMIAIKITGADVALINYTNYVGAAYEDFYEALNCNLILSFGVTSKALKTSESSLHALAHHKNSKIIYTQHLHVLAADELAKRQLWNSLKTLI